MKIQDIPQFMGLPAANLAANLGIKKQALFSYTSGKRGKPSKFVAELLAFCGLNREEVIFSDPFDHPAGDNPESPVYWCALALEALHQAKEKGLSEKDAKQIAAAIHEAVEKHIK